MTDLLNGAIMMTYATIGLFFWRFWKNSRDRFYVMFAAAFWILAVNRVLIANVAVADEGLPIYYLVRLLAFLLILVAIVHKNYER